MVYVNGFGIVLGSEKLDKIALEVPAEVVDYFVGACLTDDLHLPRVALASDMAFEAILITALLFAGLTVPAKSLEAFGLEFVLGDRLSRVCKITV